MNQTLDLKKVKNIIFDDIEKLLDSFNLDYRVDGDNIFMCCPIHEASDNKNGLSISKTRKTWRCWTRGCHEEYQSDIFGFIQGVMQNDFSNVLRHVCKLYDVGEAKSDGLIINSDKMFSDDFTQVVKTFVRSTKYRNDAETYQLLGYEPVSVSNTSKYFEDRGFSRSTLKHFGVADCNDKFSQMRHRSIIPINLYGQQVGFIARSTKDWIQPKYLFSPGITKTDFLYNYDEAIEKAEELGCMFLVEGQGDVWRLYEAGVKNAVGLFGKDISGAQRERLISKRITTLIILTDNDQAGRESKIKIKRDMGRLFKLIFPKMHKKDLGDMSVEHIKTNILNTLKGYY